MYLVAALFSAHTRTTQFYEDELAQDQTERATISTDMYSDIEQGIDSLTNMYMD